MIISSSSEEATLNVSCIKTPVMTFKTAKPMTHLYVTKKMPKYSLTSLLSKLLAGEPPRVNSNKVTHDRLKVPNIANTLSLACSGFSVSRIQSVKMWFNTSAQKNMTRNNSAVDQTKIDMD